jgi:hypothetical protein
VYVPPGPITGVIGLPGAGKTFKFSTDELSTMAEGSGSCWQGLPQAGRGACRNAAAKHVRFGLVTGDSSILCT